MCGPFKISNSSFCAITSLRKNIFVHKTKYDSKVTLVCQVQNDIYDDNLEMNVS